MYQQSEDYPNKLQSQSVPEPDCPQLREAMQHYEAIEAAYNFVTKQQDLEARAAIEAIHTGARRIITRLADICLAGPALDFTTAEYLVSQLALAATLSEDIARRFLIDIDKPVTANTILPVNTNSSRNLGSYNNNPGSSRNLGSYNNNLGSYNGSLGDYNNNLGSYNGSLGSYDNNLGSYNGSLGSYDNNLGSYNGSIGNSAPLRSLGYYGGINRNDRSRELNSAPAEYSLNVRLPGGKIKCYGADKTSKLSELVAQIKEDTNHKGGIVLTMGNHVIIGEPDSLLLRLLASIYEPDLPIIAALA